MLVSSLGFTGEQPEIGDDERREIVQKNLQQKPTVDRPRDEDVGVVEKRQPRPDDERDDARPIEVFSFQTRAEYVRGHDGCGCYGEISVCGVETGLRTYPSDGAIVSRVRIETPCDDRLTGV